MSVMPDLHDSLPGKKRTKVGNMMLNIAAKQETRRPDASTNPYLPFSGKIEAVVEKAVGEDGGDGGLGLARRVRIRIRIALILS